MNVRHDGHRGIHHPFSRRNHRPSAAKPDSKDASTEIRIRLRGDLGAGKTTLVKGIAAGFGAAN